jgi:hypothetical protein
MFDHTIDALPDHHVNFHFYKIGIRGNVPNDDMLTLEQHLHRNCDATSLLLKIDVEGSEWDVFSSASYDVLSRFDQIVGEFHWLHQLSNAEFRLKFIESMKRLTEQFTIFHVHSNNCRPLAIVDGFTVADVLELSFVRTNLITRRESRSLYPSPLDQANNAIVHDHALLFYPFIPSCASNDDVRHLIEKIGAERLPII